jgi:hypothetical protein
VSNERKQEIQVYRIWTEYSPDPNDPAKMREIDMIAYGPVGAHDRNVTHARVKDLSRVVADDGKQNPAVAMSRYKWDVIRPYYEAFKAGKEHTPNGTPLAAWNALTPEQGEQLRLRGVHTVESLSELNDTHVQRFGLPGLAGLIHLAGLYLKNSNTSKATLEMDAMKAQLEAQREANEELTKMVQELLAAAKAPQPVAEQPTRPLKKAA